MAKRTITLSTGEAIEFERGSGNVFADLGRPNADELLYKSQLISAIDSAIRERKLTQVEASKILGFKQSDLSKLLRGRMFSVSVDRLAKMLLDLGHNVEMVISAPENREKGVFSVRMVG